MEPLDENFPITVVQAATFSLPLFFVDNDGDIIDLTGWTARMQIRQTIESEDPALVDLTTENGGILVDVGAGSMTVIITPYQTSNLEPMSAVYDLFVTSLGGFVQRYLAGIATIQERITR